MVVVAALPKPAKGFSYFQFFLLKLDNSHVQATFPFNIFALICDKSLTSYKTSYVVM